MKKKHIIAFLFLLFFNVNTIYAKEYEFTAEDFGGETKLKELFKVVCSGENETKCIPNFERKNNNDFIDNSVGCSINTDVCTFKSFWINVDNGSLSGLKTYLDKTQCNGQNCTRYIINNYCNNYNSLDVDNNRYKICKTFTPDTESNDDSATCKYKFTARQTKDNLDITIEYQKEASKIKITTINKTTNDVRVLPDINNEYKQNFNFQDILYFYEINSSYNVFSQDYIKKFKENNTCPTLYFGCEPKDSNLGNYKWYTYLDESKVQNKFRQISVNGQTNTYTSMSSGTTDLLKEPVPFTCDDFFGGTGGEKLKTLIKMIINVVKILIPMILIGLGILDFSKAIFAGSEDAMKKAQSKFIKRIIIALCIFLVPSLIKVVLGIAHGIWPSISDSFCGILD